MTRRSKPSNPEAIRSELVELLQDFKSELDKPNLRKKVLALIPVAQKLKDLGCSLIPENQAASARARILFYLKKYPKTIVQGNELLVVSGISEWARRVRELRVQFGWPIINGVTAKEMKKEGDFPLSKVDVSEMKPDEYLLLEKTNDTEAAYRWNMANEVRRARGSVRDRILTFLRRNVGKQVTGEELRYVGGNKTEWARRVRELRTEFGWPIATKPAGRPDLSVGVYLLEEDRQSPIHDRKIPDPIRNEVLRRDEYKCQQCDWNHLIWNPSDPRHLELHHVTHHVKGGKNSAENLITVCTRCHDEIHRKEK